MMAKGGEWLDPGVEVASGLLYAALAGPDAVGRLRKLDEDGRLTSIVPDLAVMKGSSQPRQHFWDVFDHSLETVAALEHVLGVDREGQFDPVFAVPLGLDLQAHFAEPIDGRWDRLTLLKLAALLHDIAKPATRVVQKDGRIRFFHHASQGAEMARDIMRGLGFGEAAVGLVSLLVDNHLRPGQIGWTPFPTERALSRFFRELGEATPDLLVLNLADHLAMRGPLMERRDWLLHVRASEYLLWEYAQPEAPGVPSRLVSGHDLMEALGLEPGPTLGALLRAVQEAQAADQVRTREQAIVLASRLLHEKDGS